MQTKVIIGTVAFMLVMIILGVATLLEPARLEENTEAYAGRQIENGAALYHASCAECHGAEGKALSCADYSGNEKDCIGLPLNNQLLLCGEPTSVRMEQMGWTSSKERFIYQTIAAGRPPTQMPTWSQEFGGPMEDYQIEQLAAFVMNWSEDPTLCGEGAVVVEQVDWPESWEDLPEGNVDNGPSLYNQYVCFSCHGDPANPGSATVGPDLNNIANVAASRVDGMSAEQYIYESILNPDAFIVEECPSGPCVSPSLMTPQNFGLRMSLEDMADLVAYYMTLNSE
jgi:mono/diheme cytochrome c family protein